MPIDVSVHPDRSIGLFRMHGMIDVAQGMSSFRTYVQHPQFDPAFTMLSDTSNITEVQATFLGIVGGVQRSLFLLNEFRQETRSIVYAPHDVAFGMARILQQVAEPLSRLRFEIFTDEAQSLTKAGQTETSFAALIAALAADAPPR